MDFSIITWVLRGCQLILYFTSINPRDLEKSNLQKKKKKNHLKKETVAKAKVS